MGNFFGITFIAVFAAQFLGTVAYLVQIGRLLRRLESKHKAIHEALGSPLLVFNNTPRNNMLVLGWLWHREFETIDDVETVALARSVRTLLLALASGLGVMILLFALLSVSSRGRAT
jgi:hypothetical protein